LTSLSLIAFRTSLAVFISQHPLKWGEGGMAGRDGA
jgi:hypothetical protein